ncbi:MAG: TetR family transcriptional regulator [Rhizobiales bacterium]|nr:TetR family transcriptional regulator [Hyphomicrobiales bacterium]|tara:strand:+ start:8282 stop:8875 length:594 start_codon:yes stop_codon:yes gene_type:complete
MSRGRVRHFELDQALDRAEVVFRARGYAGAGVTDLMAAMGIGSGSFYAAFSSKSGLYERVLSRHAKARLGAANVALAHPDARQALACLIDSAVDDLCRPDMPGCLFVRSGAHHLVTSAQCWAGYRAALLGDITAACRRLDLSAAGASACAARVMLILDALNTQAVAGCDRATLVATGQDALTIQLLVALEGRRWLAA